MSPPPSRLSRDKIVAAARSSVVENGRGALSLRPLAARLGVTAPALYAHFASKEALLTAVAEDEFERLLAQIERVADDAPDPLERVKAQAHAYVTYALANPALFEIIFEFRPPWSSVPTGEELPLASKAFEISSVAVVDAIAAGQLRETDPLMASLTIWAAVHGVATVLAAGPGLGDEYETALVRSVIDNIVSGLAVTVHEPRTNGGD
jgi:AcrR family transcriptional regulator